MAKSCTDPELSVSGTSCPETKDRSCNDFSLTKIAGRDNCFIESVMREAEDIGGATINVHKLLGVHEQASLTDITGNGNPISGGDNGAFPASNAFETYVTEWRSLQVGAAVINDAYIGYDFGEILLENGRQRYGIDTNVRHQVATIKIKQSATAEARATKARVERSDDGVTWYGVAMVTLPDDSELNTVSFKHSAPSRYWRLRPIEFNGTTANMPWGVLALELSEYNETSIENIEDPLFLENRNRDYAETAIELKGTYDLIDIQTDFTRFGLELPSQQLYIHMNFNAIVERLGRPIVIGDILEIPSETQYTPTMRPVLKYVEVTDVGWSTEGYSPGWQPMVVRVIAQPMIASQETQDIFGGLDPIVGIDGLSDLDDGNHPVFQDDSAISQSVIAEAEANLPERGSEEATDIRHFSQEEVDAVAAIGGTNIAKYGSNQTRLYVEDGLPPNGQPYSEGDEFPSTPSNGDYHRLTYTEIGTDIPTRLFRYSAVKSRWIFQEVDRRKQYNATKPILQEYLSSPTRVNNDEVE